MSTLQEELNEIREGRGGYLEHDLLQIKHAENNRVDNPIPCAGEKAIDFTLPDDQGNEVSLDDLIKTGPLVLNFFRGNFCEFCQLELKALQRSLKDFEKLNAKLVGISPSVITLQTLARGELDLKYSILSDKGNKVAALYGLKYNISEELESIFEGFGLDLDNNLGTDNNHEHSMTIPATFVIDSNKQIIYSFYDCDHTKRAEPSEVVACLMSIN